MAVTTVAQFATELNRPATTLLEQLQAAGVAKRSADDALTDSDKERLLEHLRQSHGTAGAERKKITITKKSTTEIKQADASGKARTIQVEVRKKRVFVKREDGPGEDPAAQAAAEAAEAAELARREEEARLEAEKLAREQAEMERLARERAEAEAKARAEAEARAAEAAARAAAEAAAEAAAAEIAKKAPKPAPAPEPKPVAVPVEAPKPAVRVVKAADTAAENAAKAAELDRRRKAAEAEAAAIRAMMNAPKKVLIAKKEEP
ncbi:MAG: translation initiation factor IF-2 associated domain-containing protein, partial [Inhella sp.]